MARRRGGFGRLRATAYAILHTGTHHGNESSAKGQRRTAVHRPGAKAGSVCGDAYLLRHIVHDWDDARSIALLRKVREAMPEHARLLLVEGVIQGINHPDPTKIMDINMLVMPGDLERTESEFRALLEQAGLTLT